MAAAFGGCAQGKQQSTGTGGGTAGSGVGGSTGGSGVGGGVGGPCETDQDCAEGGRCVQVGPQKICTTSCPPECPLGSYCTLIEGDPYCVPDVDQQCGQCSTAAQCKGLTDECLVAPDGDSFCARDCTSIDDCPTGFICMEKTDYAALSAGAGGSAGGGGSGTGTGGAGGAGGGLPDGGPSLPDSGVSNPPPGIPHRFCVPPDMYSCACNDKRDGVTKSCSVENTFGKCGGTETCDGKGGAWVGCTAKTPAAETCNADDDDCNGASDEGDPDALCGGAPLHGHYACTAGACELGACDPGWTQYPTGEPSDGCDCAVDPSEPNDVCGAAASAGAVSDNAGPIQISGTLSADNDVDVWMFDTVDTDEGTTNSYHVSIALIDGGDATYLLDVIRGGTCTDAPSGPATAITAYDWCVDGKSADGTAGEAPCAPDGPVHCNDNSAKYYVRVYRKPDAPLTCGAYKLQVAAKGGAACDFTSQCQ